MPKTSKMNDMLSKLTAQ